MSPESSISQGTWDVVCCSLEPWDEVWRRNQFFAAHILEVRRDVRVLFVEPPVDLAWSVLRGRRIPPTGLRPVGGTGRLWAFRPRKLVPRRLSRHVDRRLCRGVQRMVRRLELRNPVLWINDTSYAELPAVTGFPSVYDITDDWKAAGRGGREHRRQVTHDFLLLQAADEVVVCSPDLARSRSEERTVHLITNAVDPGHFRSPRQRPADLPPGPVVLYSGTLSEDRLDIELAVELAVALSGRAAVVFVGPDACTAESTARLHQSGSLLLGARPYREMPAYLQHADVLIVPHVVNPFTESLDPIKAREFLAVGRPVVSTPVAGFRDLTHPVEIAERHDFVVAVMDALTRPVPEGLGPLDTDLPTWTERGDQFIEVLELARATAGLGRSRA